MNVYVKILLASFGTLVVVHLINLNHRFQGYGNTLIKHYPGACSHVKGIETKGGEDMTLLPSGQIIISSGLVGFDRAVDKIQHGALYLIDANKDMRNAVRLNLEGVSEDEHFSPHGIHHWVHKNGSVSVFVVVHQPEGVLRFLFDGQKTLTLTKVYRSKHFHNLNSIFVTSEDSFYATNIMKANFGDKAKMLFEFILSLPLGDIVYVNGNISEVVMDGLLSSNGLTGNDKYLYVAVVNNIHIYRIALDKSLKFYKAIPIVIGSLDNLKLDEDGDLWIGCQPIERNVINHMEEPDEIPCYSQILRVRDPENSAVVESVFLDDGNFLSGSSVALHVKGKMIVGTILHKVAVCDVHYLINK